MYNLDCLIFKYYVEECPSFKRINIKNERIIMSYIIIILIKIIIVDIYHFEIKTKNH